MYSRQLVTILVLVIQLGLGVVPLRGILCLNQGVCTPLPHAGGVHGTTDAGPVGDTHSSAGTEADIESPCCGRCADEDSTTDSWPVPVDGECPPECHCCFEVTTVQANIRPLTLSMGAALELSLAAAWNVAAILPVASMLALPCTAPFGMPPPDAPLQSAAVGLSTVCLII